MSGNLLNDSSQLEYDLDDLDGQLADLVKDVMWYITNGEPVDNDLIQTIMRIRKELDDIRGNVGNIKNDLERLKDDFDKRM